MRYLTLGDLERAIPRQALIWLSHEDRHATDPDVAVLEDVVRQAEELVDAHLRGRYTLPLDPVPTVIKDLAVNLARHTLYARRPEGNDLPQAVTDTYKAALRMLCDIRDGKITLGIAATGAAQPEPGAYKVRARKRRQGLPDSREWGAV